MKEPAASFVLNVTDIQTIVNAKLLAYTSVLVDEYTAAVAITLWDKLCTDKTQLHDTMSDILKLFEEIHEKRLSITDCKQALAEEADFIIA